MKLPRLAVLWLLLGWLFVVLYPDPSLLLRSVSNFRHWDVDAAAVRSLAATLPDDPRLIEEAVLTEVVPYAFDWQASGVPWYFPSTAEVLELGRGDCESRAVLLASLLKAKNIPFEIMVSFDHTWVQYPGKQPNALENEDVALGHRGDDGFFWHWPEDFDLGTEINTQIEVFWTPMPASRKALLFCGLMLGLLINPVVEARRRRAGFRLLPAVMPYRTRAAA